MSRKFLDLSGKIDRLVPVLAEIIQITDTLEIPFFLVGATVRDLILEHEYGISTIRATYDLDLAVQIESWEEYNTLTGKLIETERFKKGRRPHTLISNNELPIDILPFGQIENEERKIIWPPENEFSTSVIGFKDVFENAITVRLRSEPALDVKTASLPGLVVLKLIAWRDRSSGNNRDAPDLALMLENYSDTGNEDRLYNDHIDILKEANYEFGKAGARLLGRDIAAIIKPDTKDEIMQIIDEETNEQGQFRLISQIIRGSHSYDEDFEKYLNLLIELNKGIVESGPE